MILDNVEIFNCSQANTYKAALRFEQMVMPTGSSVTNSAIHGSLAWALYMTSAKFVTFKGNTIAGAQQFGINLMSVQESTIEDNFIGDVVRR